MLGNTMAFVVDNLVNLFVLAVLTRFYAQALRAPFRNPITDFVIALTDWAVRPLRRVIPPFGGLDLASLFLAWVSLLVLLLVLFAIQNGGAAISPIFLPGLAALAVVKLLQLSVYLLMGVVIIQALLSWVSPYHPMQPFFDALTRPFLRPLRRIVPLVGGVDLSPWVLLILLQVILMLPLAFLHQAIGVLFNAASGS